MVNVKYLYIFIKKVSKIDIFDIFIVGIKFIILYFLYRGNYRFSYYKY